MLYVPLTPWFWFSNTCDSQYSMWRYTELTMRFSCFWRFARQHIIAKMRFQTENTHMIDNWKTWINISDTFNACRKASGKQSLLYRSSPYFKNPWFELAQVCFQNMVRRKGKSPLFNISRNVFMENQWRVSFLKYPVFAKWTRQISCVSKRI